MTRLFPNKYLALNDTSVSEKIALNPQIHSIKKKNMKHPYE